MNKRMKPEHWVVVVGSLLVIAGIIAMVLNPEKEIVQVDNNSDQQHDTVIMPNFGQGGGINLGGVVLYP